MQIGPVPFLGSEPELGGPTTLYQTGPFSFDGKSLSANECGQVTIDSKYAKEAKAIDKNIKTGLCKDNGFPVAEGKDTIHVPIIGSLDVLKFKKSS